MMPLVDKRGGGFFMGFTTAFGHDKGCKGITKRTMAKSRGRRVARQS